MSRLLQFFIFGIIIIFITLGVIKATKEKTKSESLLEIIETDKAFSKKCFEEGMSNSFSTFADDGVYKILGDENNIIYRVNPETGRIQEYSDGFWSNTASNPIARGTARKEGFQKIADPSQKQDTEVNPTLKDVKSTNKALEELTEDQTEDVDDIASEYILSVASNKLNTIIEESGLPESIKKIIRKRFSLNEKGEYVSSIPFDKIVNLKIYYVLKDLQKMLE